MSTLLQNGRIIDPANQIDGRGSILIDQGVIQEIYLDAPPADLPEDCAIIDASNNWLVPGLIDMHVHLREPGQEHKETIASGCKAAVAGGFTAVACMPNSTPINDGQEITIFILAKAAEADLCRVHPVGAISKNSGGSELSEFGELKKAGAVAVSDDGLPVESSQLMRRALEYSGNYDLPVISHSEEMTLSQNGAMNEGALATRLGLRGIPHVAEEIMVYRDIALASYLRRPLHLAHLSTEESIDLVRRAKAKGAMITAETAPHYFTLTEAAVADYDTHAKMNPPLRSEADRQAIRLGIADGTIDAIASDHAPHSQLEKMVEFDLAANGIIGLETSLPLSLALVRDGLITPSRLVELLSLNPARILKVGGGTLAKGAPADITVIDPDSSFCYERQDIVSKSENSPFLGQELQGRAVLTMVAGQVRHTTL
ncbi:MAG: dihydroorotase [Thermodesulfobacteriota bacterium]